jgi:hypothetical protein
MLPTSEIFLQHSIRLSCKQYFLNKIFLKSSAHFGPFLTSNTEPHRTAIAQENSLVVLGLFLQ